MAAPHKPYKWKHGWIPVTPGAALEKAHGSQAGAEKVRRQFKIPDNYDADLFGNGRQVAIRKPAAPAVVARRPGAVSPAYGKHVPAAKARFKAPPAPAPKPAAKELLSSGFRFDPELGEFVPAAGKAPTPKAEKHLYHGASERASDHVRTNGLTNTTGSPGWFMLTDSKEQAATYANGGKVTEFHVPKSQVYSRGNSDAKLWPGQPHDVYGHNATAYALKNDLPPTAIHRVHSADAILAPTASPAPDVPKAPAPIVKAAAGGNRRPAPKAKPSKRKMPTFTDADYDPATGTYSKAVEIRLPGDPRNAKAAPPAPAPVTPSAPSEPAVRPRATPTTIVNTVTLADGRTHTRTSATGLAYSHAVYGTHPSDKEPGKVSLLSMHRNEAGALKEINVHRRRGWENLGLAEVTSTVEPRHTGNRPTSSVTGPPTPAPIAKAAARKPIPARPSSTTTRQIPDAKALTVRREAQHNERVAHEAKVEVDVKAERRRQAEERRAQKAAAAKAAAAHKDAARPLRHHSLDELGELGADHAANDDRAGLAEVSRELRLRHNAANRTVVQQLGSLNTEQLDNLAADMMENDPDGSRIELLAKVMDDREALPTDRLGKRAINDDPILKAAIEKIRRDALDANAQRATENRRHDAWEARVQQDAMIEGRMLEAEAATNGNMLNKRAIHDSGDFGVKLTRDLMSGKLNAATMRKIVTPELAEWFAQHGWPVPRKYLTGSNTDRKTFVTNRGSMSEYG